MAGQYSSGKSTIIRALTGRNDIPAGAGITTDRTHDYDWQGILVTDTPGIHTSIRSGHDEQSYRAISEADLLVFVITNELFDEHTGRNYRELAIEQQKAHETIVVVNKMDRHADGNTPESREILTRALRQPLEPFTPEEMRLTFIAAQSALEAHEEPDTEMAEFLSAQGNITALTDNLNDLIRDKGLSARQTTKLYSMRRLISEALEDQRSGDPDADALILVYNQNIRAITEAAATIRGEIRLAIAETKERIRNTAHQVNDILEVPKGKGLQEKAEEAANEAIQEALEELDDKIARAFADALPELQSRIEAMSEGQLHQSVTLNPESSGKRESWTRALPIIQTLAKTAEEAAARLTVNNAAATAGLTGLRAFSGSPVHGIILTVGRALGHSFQPWQAVRLAQSISRAAVPLALASVVIGVILEIREQREAEKREQEKLEARQNIRAEFAKIAQEVGKEAEDHAESVIREILETPLQQIATARDEINLAREENNRHIRQLNKLQADIDALIRRIHSEGTITTQRQPKESDD